MCLGKGLTGGTLPLSATLAREDVYAAFLGDFGSSRHLFHGHSFAANPICCAAALASLEIFEREATLVRVAELERTLATRFTALRANPGIREIRHKGLMCAIELETHSVEASDPRSPAWGIADRMYERGYFTRPLGDAIQLVPPLASDENDLLGFTGALEDALHVAAHA
jgi:adenosylmethionine-8-amino-7-oxononanoate aminotransferase